MPSQIVRERRLQRVQYGAVVASGQNRLIIRLCPRTNICTKASAILTIARAGRLGCRYQRSHDQSNRLHEMQETFNPSFDLAASKMWNSGCNGIRPPWPMKSYAVRPFYHRWGSAEVLKLRLPIAEAHGFLRIYLPFGQSEQRQFASTAL